MPKRASTSDTLKGSKPESAISKPQKKTERSHEENQERAYIAASRRADRSIEARVQSARMASEIHKKRTGKSFRITEEIVTKEEMYEEEDDEFPRSYRLLGPHMQTGSAEMNSKLEAFLTNKIAMSQYVARGGERWEKENEINKLFAASFPNLEAQAKALSHSFSKPNYQKGDEASKGDVVPQSPMSPMSPSFQQSPQHRLPATFQRHDSNPTESSGPISPPALSPASPVSHHTPSFSMPGPMDFGGSSSAFTTELSNDARMMFAGFNSEPYAQGMYDFASFDPMSGPQQGEQQAFVDPKLARTDDGMFGAGMQSPMAWDQGMGMSNSQANDEDWNSFINDNFWSSEQNATGQ